MNDEMMLDARVRRGLQALPVPAAPSTTAALARVTGRERRTARDPWRVALVAAVAAGLVMAGPALLRTVAGGDDEPTPAPSAGSELHGSWTRTADPRTEPSWQGEWQVSFDDQGVLGVTSPAGARAVTEGAAYAVTGSQLRVDLFVNSVCYEIPPASYLWSVSSDGLRLTSRDDDCAPRRELLSGTWRAAR